MTQTTPSPNQSRKTTIRAGQHLATPRELIRYRELAYFFCWRDIKVRYKQTALGISWVVLQPLAMTLVFTALLGRLVKLPSDGIPYHLFAYSGFLIWMFFSNAVSAASQSIVSNGYLITKVYFPRLIIPCTVVSVRLIDFCIAFIVLALLILANGAGLHSSIVLLPVWLILLTMLTASLSIALSVLTVWYRDISTILPMVLQIWMFSSPIVYSKSLIPDQFKALYALNPLVGIIDGFRSSLFGLPTDWATLMPAITLTFAAFCSSIWLFQRFDRNLADHV